jgi:hypothetical protein
MAIVPVPQASYTAHLGLRRLDLGSRESRPQRLKRPPKEAHPRLERGVSLPLGLGRNVKPQKNFQTPQILRGDSAELMGVMDSARRYGLHVVYTRVNYFMATMCLHYLAEGLLLLNIGLCLIPC